MQRVSLAVLQSGMTVAGNVRGADGRLLVRNGMVLTDASIKKLASLGIGSVYIRNPLFEAIDVPELVREDTRVKLIRALQTAFAGYQKSGDLDTAALRGEVKTMVAEIVGNRESMIHTFDLRTYQDYVYAHSVNVAIISVLIALSLDYNEARLIDLALGALLHDIGMLAVPKDIILKVGNLTPAESEAMQRHVNDGFEIIRKRREISTLAAHVAFQHHERIDGTGYPRRLKGDNIHEYARIVAVADIFDALIADRPYRKGMLPHEAYEIMMTLADKYLDKAILDIFLANVAIYPVGTVVRLSGGETAVVASVRPRLQARPVVKILLDAAGAVVENGPDLDLAEHLTVFVTKVYKEHELFELRAFAAGLRNDGGGATQ
ncbi:HD-GYP domain-containing protein [Anaeroselena agilis]|uniref:HD-GYP domain-containing protein n=1 Tax=Anaeroselena agilis TaxID=3063788 RepID=A0ABU3P0B1_9FIRM|nr:HD-GYP domain-containing protein [Selenomonadales bacterium 4137-cl]